MAQQWGIIIWRPDCLAGSFVRNGETFSNICRTRFCLFHWQTSQHWGEWKSMFNNIHLKRINFSLERKKEEFPRIIQMNVKCCTNFFKTPESLKHQIQNWREDFSPKKKITRNFTMKLWKKKKFLHSNHNNKNFEKLKQRFVSEWHFWKKYSLERTLSVLIFNTNYIWHQWAKKILLKNWMFFFKNGSHNFGGWKCCAHTV